MPAARSEGSRPILIITAAEGEAAAIARALSTGRRAAKVGPEWRPVAAGPRVHLVRSGVGKVNAAACALLAVQPGRYGAVLNMGIAGALPRDSACRRFRAELGEVVVATHSVYADEGIVTPRGYQELSSMGFPIGGSDDGSAGIDGPAIAGDRRLLARLIGAFPPGVRHAPIATVSTCSGTNASAYAVARRTSAVAEGMEGAAAAHALARRDRGRSPFAEVRVISNTTGDRDRQVWRIKESLERLGEVARWVEAALT